MGEKQINERLDQLAARIDKLEQSAGRRSMAAGTSDDEEGTEELRYCSVPQVPERTFDSSVSDTRARAIMSLDNKWVNGTVLRYYFFTQPPWGGRAAEFDVVRRAYKIWTEVGIGIRFEEVTTIDNADVRIGFLRGDGSWSYVGREIRNQGARERTMNFGWDITPAREIDTALHEIGHTLGLHHEHQNPLGGIVWNEQAVFSYFGGPPNNWGPQKTQWNVLRKIPQASVEGTEWDPNSIMEYAFGAGLVIQPPQYRNGIRPNGGLSELDKTVIRRFYPPSDSAPPPSQLRPFESQSFSIQPGEQRDFTVRPDADRYYTFSTFGGSDTVMVLFEERDGQQRYVSGDDDSGTDRNASFTVALERSRTYVLRIRLYYSFGSGQTAVMMW